MDIGRILAVLWKRKLLILLGVIVGAALSFLVGYSVRMNLNPSDGPFVSYRQRVPATYMTTVKLVLDESGFGLGRVDRDVRGQWERTERIKDLAAIYSHLMMSDQLTGRLAPDIKKVNGQISAAPLQKLPIVEISVSGSDPEGVRSLALKAANNFINYVKWEQAKNKIQPVDRIVIKAIGQPSPPTKAQSRRGELAFLAFVLPVFGASFIVFSLENMERHRLSKNPI
ncbi:MAG: hypothetical protein M1548_02615 [Actinobacteria bacterium]|nr:hypothetical protein [Actinomycetota bacterium]